MTKQEKQPDHGRDETAEFIVTMLEMPPVDRKAAVILATGMRIGRASRLDEPKPDPQPAA